MPLQSRWVPIKRHCYPQHCKSNADNRIYGPFARNLFSSVLAEKILCQLSTLLTNPTKLPICIKCFLINHIDWQGNYWTRVALQLWGTIKAITTVKDLNHPFCGCISPVPQKCKLREQILCGQDTIYFCPYDWFHPADESVFIKFSNFQLSWCNVHVISTRWHLTN